jgi:flavin reductase (DIM6/NTAB) family NADH-FMN oxidoreductase RutF
MQSIDPKDLPIQRLHQLLLGAIGPRPIAFAATINAKGEHNLAPFSFFNVFSANPPILVFSPARSGRTGQSKDTYNNVKEVPEVVINVVNYNMVHQMSLASSPYAPEIDEFVKSGFTALASEKIKPHRVAQAPVQFECKVNQVIELGQEGGAGNLIICEVVQIHIDPTVLNEQGLIDQQKPITTCGIGYDALPPDIKASEVLSANDLGQLAGIEALPNETDVNEYKLIELAPLFLELEDDAQALEKALHLQAKELLAQNELEAAWLTLLSFNN